MPRGAPSTDPDGDSVGARVKARRGAAGLSIAEVARRAEVSAPFISQLEAGRTSISLPTLYRVADALGCNPSALLGGAEAVHDHVVRTGEGVRLPASDSAHAQRPRLLSRTGDDVLLRAYHYEIHPDDDAQDWFEHAGEDLVYVISGTIAIEFANGHSIELGPGDSLHHGGADPHRWELRGGVPAEVLIVIGVP